MIDQINSLCINASYDTSAIYESYQANPTEYAFYTSGNTTLQIEPLYDDAQNNVKFRFVGENRDCTVHYVKDKLAPHGSCTLIAEGDDVIIIKYLLGEIVNLQKAAAEKGLKLVFKSYRDIFHVQFLDGSMGTFQHPKFEFSNFAEAFEPFHIRHHELQVGELIFSLDEIIKHTAIGDLENTYIQIGTGDNGYQNKIFKGYLHGMYPFKKDEFIGVGGFSGHGRYDSGGTWPCTPDVAYAQYQETLEGSDGQWLIDLLEQGLSNEELKIEMLKNYYSKRNCTCYWLT